MIKSRKIEWKMKKPNSVDHVDPVKRIGQDLQERHDKNRKG